LSLEKLKEGYVELQANIRRLTIMVLDNLEEGTKENILDQAQKRLLSSTGARLLRLWRTVLREGGSREVAEELERIEAAQSIPVEVKPKAGDE
jgi:5-methylcytosine-specific restriction endonuclease McrBC regulatory subunit McrC